MTQTNPIIKLENIDVTFKQKNKEINAVKDVSIDIYPADVYGIVGYSGAGKSTLVRTINLLQKPTHGNVIINNTYLAKDENNKEHYIKSNDLRNERKKIGMIFQHFNLMNERTVAENILFPIAHLKLNKATRQKKVSNLLKLVGLENRADAYPSQLSGGQKQRVAIARALASEPEILISDEATSALDPKTTNSILKLLKKLNQELNLTIVLITHEMQAVKEIANKVAVMEDGKIIERGSLIDIFTNPKEQLTKDFIDTATQLEEGLRKVSEQNIVKNLGPNELLVQLSYVGTTTDQPLITSLFNNFKVSANILFGNIEILQNTPVGTLICVLSGDTLQLQAALNSLQKNDVKINILKGGIN